MEQVFLLIKLKLGGSIAPRPPTHGSAGPSLYYAGTVQKEKPFYTMANQQWTRCGGCIKGRQNLVLMGKPRILSHLHQIQQKNKLKKCKPRPGKQPIQKQGSKTLIITFSFPGTLGLMYV